MPEMLSEHAKNCKICHRILTTPVLWKAYISANTNNTAPKLSNEIQEGQVWKIDFDENTDAVLGIVTDNTDTCDFIRLIPIYVSPNEKDIDKETDILLKASDMPNGLPCLAEWWNFKAYNHHRTISILCKVNRFTVLNGSFYFGKLI